MEQGEGQALQAYALEIDSLYRENEQYFAMYKADLQALELSINATYQGIMAELGIEQAAMDIMQQEYDMAIGQAFDDVELALQQQELAALEETPWEDWGDEVVGLAIIAGALLCILFPPIGGITLGLGTALAGVMGAGGLLIASD